MKLVRVRLLGMSATVDTVRDSLSAARQVVSVGTLVSSVVHPREVFKGAILANAHAILVGHNHPSGDVTPSAEDRAVSERLRQAGELLGIELLDAIIVGAGDKFFSMADNSMRKFAP